MGARRSVAADPAVGDRGGGGERTIDVIVEIPRGSRNKYEYDHVNNVFRLDRRLFSATVYPADYGFVPDTLAEDGDPLDALVLIDEPTFPGCVITAKPIGIFWMTDEMGPDAKVITVACGDPMWEDLTSIEDLPPHLTQEVAHFFNVYKDLEPGKGTEVRGFDGIEAAWDEIEHSRERARAEEPD
jgi:inorganic pyrophosphatase